MEVRDTRPWFWILIAALAVLGIVALVLAISAGNESVDQKKVADEATEQVKEEVSGLNEAVETVNEFQEESAELAEEDAQRINQQVAKATEGGEEELRKLKRRVASLEDEAGLLGEETKALKQEAKATAAGQREFRAELTEEMEAARAEVTELEQQVERLEK